MGLDSGSKCGAHIYNVSLAGLLSLFRSTGTESETNNATSVYIDFNWLYINKTKSSDSIKYRVDKIINIMNIFAKCGCISYPICDPEIRHNTKRAFIYRRAKNLVSDIKIRSARYELQKVTQELMNNDLSIGSKTELIEKQSNLRKLASKNLSSSESINNAIRLLKEALADKEAKLTNESGGRIEELKTGLYQADLLISKLHSNDPSSFIIGNDADFMMLVGSNSIQLKDFNHCMRTSKITNITLMFSSNALAKQMHIKLQTFGDKSSIFKPSEYEFFSKYKSLRTRAIIGFSLGSDIYPGGCKGTGPSKLNNEILKIEKSGSQNLDNDLIAWLSNKMSTTISVIESYIEVLMYEPADDLGPDFKDRNKYDYLEERPSSVHYYSEDFIHDNDNHCVIIRDKAELFNCQSIDSIVSHICLEFEMKQCTKCKSNVCRHCLISETNSTNMCLKCYHGDNFIDTSDLESKDKSQLIKEISTNSYGGSYRLGHLSDCPLDELQIIYKDIVINKNLENNIANVKYPLQSWASTFSSGKANVIDSFNFYSEGGSFLFRDSFKKYVPNLLYFLEQCVTFNNHKHRISLPYWNKVYDILPGLITNIAYNSRRDSAFRVCFRCIRHLTDPKFEDVRISKVNVIELISDEGNTLALYWSCRIPASMKDVFYNVKICMTYDGDLQCSECDCVAAGGEKEYQFDHNNHMICVHICPAIMKITTLLCDFMAEDLCYELCSELTKKPTYDTYEENEMNQMRKSIITLSSIALTSRGKKVSDNLSSLSIIEILQSYFNVGTEKSKASTTYNGLCPLQHMPISRILRKSIFSLGKKMIMNEDYTFEHNKLRIDKSIFEPNYSLVAFILENVFKIKDDDAIYKYIGFKILNHRSDKMSTEKDSYDIKALTSIWNNGIELSKIRPRKINNKAGHGKKQLKPAIHKKKTTMKLRSRRKSKPTGSRGCSYKCCFPGCNSAYPKDNVNWHRVLTEPKNPPKTSRYEQWKNYYIKLRTIWVIKDRLGIKSKNIAYPVWCSLHENPTPFKAETKFKFNGKEFKEKFNIFPVPSNVGPKVSNAITENKGIGIDRGNNNFLKKTDENDKLGMIMGYCTYSPNRIKTGAEAKLLKNANLLNEKKKTVPRKLTFESRLVPVNEPYVKLGMKCEEVKRRTGFRNEKSLLACALIACNGSIDILITSSSKLTWYEEWFLFFEFGWGKTMRRWQDICSASAYDINNSTARRIFDIKMLQIYKCRESWPPFAFYEEDAKFRNNKWNDKFNGKRIIMWDNTNINFNFKPTASHVQRLTYSTYYGTNCAKGGVGKQLCAWQRGTDLWTGGVSDTEYFIGELKRNGINENNENSNISKNTLIDMAILDSQQLFQDEDLVDGKLVKFVNYLDKGYRVTREIHAHDQKVVQPIYVSNKVGFSFEDGLCSSEVASDRSGNERAVRLAKLSDFLTDGVHNNQSFERMNIFWKCFNFLTNFMTEPSL